MPLASTNRAKIFAKPQPHRDTPRGKPAPSSSSRAPLLPLVQAKLRIGAPGHPCEREADRVAEQVMRMPVPGWGAALPLMTRDAPASGSARNTPGQALILPPEIQDGIPSLRSGGRPLENRVRNFFDPRFGCDLGAVRVHTDGRAAEMAAAIHARAFTFGQDIVFGAGQYAPDSESGRKLMAHELTHAIQQSRGSPPAASSKTLRCQPNPEPPRFSDFPRLALKLEEDVGRNLLDYGHHLYRIAALYPGRSDLLEEAFGRYALGANVLETGFSFLGLDPSRAKRFTYGSGILLKGLTFVSKGEFVLDLQFDIGHGLKVETNIDLAVNPSDFGDVRKAEVGLGLVGRF